MKEESHLSTVKCLQKFGWEVLHHLSLAPKWLYDMFAALENCFGAQSVQTSFWGFRSSKSHNSGQNAYTSLRMAPVNWCTGGISTYRNVQSGYVEEWLRVDYNPECVVCWFYVWSERNNFVKVSLRSAHVHWCVGTWTELVWLGVGINGMLWWTR
jgi:hypothetical protein